MPKTNLPKAVSKPRCAHTDGFDMVRVVTYVNNRPHAQMKHVCRRCYKQLTPAEVQRVMQAIKAKRNA